MKFILSIFAAAATALAASAAVTESTQVATTELPARFAMYVVTDADSKANGHRVQYRAYKLSLDVEEHPTSNSVDGVFLGGRGRIALDLTVHVHPDGGLSPGLDQRGDWNVVLMPGVSEIEVMSETLQELNSKRAARDHVTVGKWVQDSNGMLRLLDAKGALVNNGLRICSVFTDGGLFQFWWDPIPYLDCAVAEFKIVPL